MAMVILSTAVAAGFSTYGAFARGTLYDAEAVVAQELASQLMTEIQVQDYDPPGYPGSFGRLPSEPADGPRSLYNDVDDYDDWSASPPEMPDGTEMNGYTGYVRSVIVTNVDDATLSSAQSDGATDSKRIVVTVTRNGKLRARLTGYRINQNGFD
ncbi:MAG: hypothetical protein IID37_14570 [Planctomycetes bacterium]|nr:hypothetical protein [Planctomycetota bacterium]